MKYYLVIPGEPMGKQRARSTRWGHHYTPKKTVNYEAYIKQLFACEYMGSKPTEEELNVKIDAYFTIPKSTSKRKKAKMIKGEIRPTKRPDVDNIAKIILDAFNKLAYLDDKQVVSCKVEKYYSEIPRVEVTIENVNVQ